MSRFLCFYIKQVPRKLQTDHNSTHYDIVYPAPVQHDVQVSMMYNMDIDMTAIEQESYSTVLRPEEHINPPKEQFQNIKAYFPGIEAGKSNNGPFPVLEESLHASILEQLNHPMSGLRLKPADATEGQPVETLMGSFQLEAPEPTEATIRFLAQTPDRPSSRSPTPESSTGKL